MSAHLASQLIDQLRQSQLVTPVQLDEFKRSLQRHCPNRKALELALVQRGWATAYQAKMLLQGAGASLVLGPYTILDQLGEGGSGQVFRTVCDCV